MRAKRAKQLRRAIAREIRPGRQRSVYRRVKRLLAARRRTTPPEKP